LAGILAGEADAGQSKTERKITSRPPPYINPRARAWISSQGSSVRDGVRLAMLARATAPFWMEFRGVGCRVRGRVGDGLGMRRRCRQRRRRVARWSAVGTVGAVGTGTCGRVGKLRRGQGAQGCAMLGKRAAAAGSRGRRPRSGLARAGAADLEALRRGWRDLERRPRSGAHLRMRNSRSPLPSGSFIPGHALRRWARRTVVRAPRASSALHADQGMTAKSP
jgi:hypothetical protein